MLLNLTIINDFLEDENILFCNADHKTKRTLKYPVYYTGEQSLRNDVVYIAVAEKLPAEVTIPATAAIICLGYPPLQYQNMDCELLCLSSNTDIVLFFNKLQELFNRFNEYEARLLCAIHQNDSFDIIGDIAFEIFKTPVTLLSKYENYFFIKFDRERPEFLETYLNIVSSAYPAEEERSIYMSDKEFVKSFETRGATHMTSEIYGTTSIYINLLEHDQYMGRFLIEDAYRNFRESDYSLVDWLGEITLKAIENTKIFYFGGSKEFESMMQMLLVENAPYQNEFTQILKQNGWLKNDEYQCVCVRPPQKYVFDANLNQDVLYLKELLDGQYLLVENNMIYQIINLTKCSYSFEEIQRRLHLFLKNNNFIAGFSVNFDDLSNAGIHMKQAVMITDLSDTLTDRRMYFFDKNILDLMFRNIKGNLPEDFYVTENIRRLFEYDKKNGTDLVKTCKVYLENNMNATKTQEILHIARTTCLYRIDRIKQITKINIEKADNRMYLLILFRLMNIE